MYNVFTVNLVARRKEGGVHSWPGFEDGPCCLQPGGLTKVTLPFPHPKPQCPIMVPIMAPKKVCERAPSTWVTVFWTVPRQAG